MKVVSSRRRGVALAAACAATLSLTVSACGSDDESGSTTANGGTSTTASGAAGSGEKIEVAHFTAYLGSPFEVASLEESRRTAASMNAEVTNFEASNDPQRQLQQCQDAIATQRFRAFIIKPVDGAAATSCARQAVEAGIAVVALDTPIGPDPEETDAQVEGIAGSVVSLPSTYGTALADMTIRACEGKDPCRVAYLFGPPAFSFIANARRVFNEAIAREPSIDVVAEESTEFVPDRAVSITRQLLQQHPDLDVITDDDDATAVALLPVVRESGRDITVIGGGGAREAVDLIARGEIFGTAVLNPRAEARKAVDIAVRVARGEDPGPDAFIDAVERLSPVGAFVTRDTASEFEAEWTTGG